MIPTTVDFETKAIGDRPEHYPPAPVGVSIRIPGQSNNYYAFGHPSGNNCTEAQAKRALRLAWTDELLFHNAGFDLSVAIERWGFPMPNPRRIHDSLWRAFFADPYSPSFSLKPLAERYLKQPPTEQEAVRQWLVDNKIIKSTLKKKWGGHICDAPGDLVGNYATGDTERAYWLWQKLGNKGQRGDEPYRREQRLLPLLLDSERRGLPVSLPRLRADVRKFNAVLENLDKQIQRGFRRKFSIDSNEELADAIEGHYKVKLPLTPKSQERQVNKAALDAAMPNNQLKGLLLYRSALAQSLSTFLRPWLQMARTTGGTLHTHWNSTRGSSEKKAGASGARTGRLSSEPNFQNLTTDQEKLEEKLLALLGHVPELPRVRSYVVAPKGFTLIGSDYSQQELRMLAHFENGPLAKQYIADPELQVHKWVQSEILRVCGFDPGYKTTKAIGFAIIYGSGIQGLMEQLKCAYDEAANLKSAYFKALPSVKVLMDEMSAVGRAGKYIETLGGRQYYCEPAKKVYGERTRTYEYKLLNCRIQGSSADQTKEAMINFWNEVKGTDARFLITAHDEIVGLCPTADRTKYLRVLRDCMLGSLQLRVPIRCDLESGRNWAEMKEVKL